MTAPEPAAPAAPLLGKVERRRLRLCLHENLAGFTSGRVADDLMAALEPLVTTLVAEQRKAEREQAYREVAAMLAKTPTAELPDAFRAISMMADAIQRGEMS